MTDPGATIGDQQWIYGLIERLFPICRSITGDGIRETLSILQETVPLDLLEVPSGTKCLDWTVPREWNIRDAHIIDPAGRKIIDFKNCNLHIVSYSTPVDETFSLAELKKHLYTLPDLPQAIPYRTAYYREDWGFCLSHEQFLGLEEGDYRVLIDTTLQDGSLTYGELLIPGRKKDEFLVSTYICHPSMCNDNLSGVAVATALARNLAQRENEFSYRFVFVPETIGSILWLSRNEARLDRIKFGLTLSSLGDAGALTYKKSRRGNTPVDQAALVALADSGMEYKIADFSPVGGDERQYCSPGFDLPIGSLRRTEYDFREYHTSLDDLDFVEPEKLGDSLAAAFGIIAAVENGNEGGGDGSRRYLSTNPKAEPQLGRRGLYALVGGRRPGENDMLPIFWVLNLSDGDHSLAQIVERSGLAFDDIRQAAELLLEHQLLEEVDFGRP